MDESERTVHAGAAREEGAVQRVCRQVVSDDVRYRFWLTRHEPSMTQVAHSKHRREQIIQLRRNAIQQVHKTALVRYLRDYRITGKDRALTLAEFHWVTDTLQAAITEHNIYLMSASTGYCAEALLAMVEDKHGLEMIQNYRETYGQFFAMYCGRARARRRGRRYLLSGLIPELQLNAAKAREELLAGHCMPPQIFGRQYRYAS